MRDFRDAKAMAQTLREALKSRSISLTHSESLELVARTLGFHDWNCLAANSVQPTHCRPARQIVRPIWPGASTVIPVAPMRDVVFFPQLISPIFVGREKTASSDRERRQQGGGRLFSGSHPEAALRR